MSMGVSTVGNGAVSYNSGKNNTALNVAKAATIGGGAFGMIGALSNYAGQKNIIKQVAKNPGCKSIKTVALSDSKKLKKAAEYCEALSKKIIEGGNKIIKSEIVKSGLKSFAKGAVIVGGIALLVNLIKGAKSSDKTAE